LEGKDKDLKLKDSMLAANLDGKKKREKELKEANAKLAEFARVETELVELYRSVEQKTEVCDVFFLWSVFEHSDRDPGERPSRQVYHGR
jgi:chromatin segregation and condensation protein Rec8/ScpA/Scc1 (kleisin family)